MTDPTPDLPELHARRDEHSEAEPSVKELHQLVRQLTNLAEVTRRGFYEGPLPPPEWLNQYADIYPDAPKILFEEMQRQGNHRRGLEHAVVTHRETRANRGQWMAFALALAAIAASVIVGLKGHDWLGGTLFGVTIVALVSLFLGGRRSESKNLESKREAMRAMIEGRRTSDTEP